MIQQARAKLTEMFFEEPAKSFQLRQISRITKIPVMTARKYALELEKEGLLIKDKTMLYPGYRANESNRLYRTYKQQTMTLRIYSSGIIDYLEKETLPRCIVLFGSVRKGEYSKDSDIDLFVQAPKKEVNLEKFEKTLKHRISLFFEPDLAKLSEELLNNIINGIVLYGHLRIGGQKWAKKK